MAGILSSAKGAVSSAISKDENKQGTSEELSLTTVLSTEDDRSALTILIADATECMRKNIVDVFEVQSVGSDAKVDAFKSVKDDDASKEVKDGSSPKDETVKEVEQPKSKAAETQQQEKELSSKQMRDLKEAALKHFDEWRTSAMQRIGETVNSKKAAEKQKEAAQPKQSVNPMRYPESSYYDANLYPPVETDLTKLPKERRALIVHSVLLLLLSLEHYQSYSRTLLLYLTTSLGLSLSFLAEDESKVARGLLTAAKKMEADEEIKKQTEKNSDSRTWKVGLATVAGAALIGVTGGLAAPFLAAGVGSVMGGLGLGATAAAGYLGTLAGSSVLVGGLFGAYGGKMTGQMMDQYAREVQDFGFVPIREQHKPRKIEYEYRRLRVSIGISGWLTNPDEVVDPWKVIGMDMESFALRWEVEALINLGNSMTTMIKSAAWGYAKTEIIKRTVFASLMAGLWPLALLKVSRVIDNPWSVASYRAQKAGEVLADALINRAQGERPVTLVGYSLGARIIYFCLQRLAQRRAFGIVETAILIGAPTPSAANEWRQIRTVVSGRVVNVFSTKDYILAFLYRSSSIQFGIAGVQAVEYVKGVENVDVSDMVAGHTAYRFLTGPILQKIGFENVDTHELKKEEELLAEKKEKGEVETAKPEPPHSRIIYPALRRSIG
ncbi:DUF726-domain-containing protein [Piedraia hortae CBS 480.64]|uniref:DUF726-domain-containing protein n=1 Tax=Piedraia hortae CBS 480.64 TaxID=1314780 RepID=A0A6A7C5W7_9PEZI|nr:DUF726-domain-containing protein [Piedraia hortae CBS 480.64]